MSSMINDFLLHALHTFQVRTLNSLGFHTRVSLSNKSGQKEQFKTDYRVDLTIYEAGRVVEVLVGIAQLPVGQMLSLDCRKWESSDSVPVERIFVFHLIPERLLANMSAEGTVSVSREEAWFLFTAQDQYVEYFRDGGFASGVLYQSGAFNYRKFSAESTTLIQAPKICLSKTLNSYVSLMHTSFEPGYDRSGTLQCALIDARGKRVANWATSVRPFQPMLLNFAEIVEEQVGDRQFLDSDAPTFFTFYALSSDATLLPLIINADVVQHTLAVEHSLPPTYYGQSISGANRALTVKDLKESRLFQMGGM